MAVFGSLEQFQEMLAAAEQSHLFDSLILLGSASDIAWLYASLPGGVAKYVTAEIQYPLMPGWFHESGLAQLTGAIKHVMIG